MSDLIGADQALDAHHAWIFEVETRLLQPVCGRPAVIVDECQDGAPGIESGQVSGTNRPANALMEVENVEILGEVLFLAGTAALIHHDHLEIRELLFGEVVHQLFQFPGTFVGGNQDRESGFFLNLPAPVAMEEPTEFFRKSLP